MHIRKIEESSLLAVSSKPASSPLYMTPEAAREKAYLLSVCIGKTAPGVWVNPAAVGLPGDACSHEQGYRDVCELFCAACELDAALSQTFATIPEDEPTPTILMAL